MKLKLCMLLMVAFSIFVGCSSNKPKESFYVRLGGQPAINAAVDIFYKKILADKRVSHFFEDVNMIRQIKRQKQFLGSALGGPIKYEGKSMHRAHAGLNIQEEHFNAIAGHLKATLQELKVDAQLIDEVIGFVATKKKDIVNK